MGDKRPYLFIYGENEDNKLIMFNRNDQMKSLLNQFLRETNSIMELDFKKITFMHRNTILNKPENLTIAIKEVIKTNTNNNIQIKVLDTNGIIGGIF